MSSTHITRNDAVREIVTAIESSGNIQNVFTEYDVDAIAENVIIEVTDDAGRLIGYQVTDDNELFWSAVEHHAL